LFILFSLGYATYVSFWALFQIRLAGFMELVPFKTTPESLSFNVRMVARLSAPLAFFYLGWIAENGLDDGSWAFNSAPPYQYWANRTTFNTSQPTSAPTTASPSIAPVFVAGVPVAEPTTLGPALTPTLSLPPSAPVPATTTSAGPVVLMMRGGEPAADLTTSPRGRPSMPSDLSRLGTNLKRSLRTETGLREALSAALKEVEVERAAHAASKKQASDGLLSMQRRLRDEAACCLMGEEA
jgi:hypothetical protein